MTVQEKRTYFQSHIVRRAAYDRLVPNGSDSGYLHWLHIKRKEFETANPHRVKRSSENRRAFDRWLERLK